jgi:tetratricopeptide (TPR) repeat protein
MHTGQYDIAYQYAKKAEAATPAGDEKSGCKFMLAGIIPMGYVFLEAYHTMIWHVFIRFGKWEEIIAYPVETDKEVFASSIATAHYARGVAFASLGRVAEAEAEQVKFLEAIANPALAGRVLHNNAMYAEEGPCVLNVNKAMLDGEIKYRKAVQEGGDVEPAFDALKLAVELSMKLKYNEPWGQMQPVRHALGALLLEQGRVDEALQVYNDDLAMWKNNMWGLLGKKLCLKAKGNTAELAEVEKAFKKASSSADKIPGATCFCAKEATNTLDEAGCTGIFNGCGK